MVLNINKQLIKRRKSLIRFATSPSKIYIACSNPVTYFLLLCNRPFNYHSKETNPGIGLSDISKINELIRNEFVCILFPS